MMVIVLLISFVSIVMGQSQMQGAGGGIDTEALINQIRLYRQATGDDGGKNLQEFRSILLETADKSGKVSSADGMHLVVLNNDQCVVVNGQFRCGMKVGVTLASPPKVNIPVLTNAEKRVISYSGTEIFVPLVRFMSYLAFIFFVYGAIRNLIAQNLLGAMQNIVMLVFVVGLLWFLGR